MCSDEAVKKGAKAGNIVKAAATVCGVAVWPSKYGSGWW